MPAAVRPAIFGPGDDDDEDLVPEVTREHVDRDREVARAAARAAQRESMTRRSWYTRTDAAEAFQTAVDDIHHATRVPKHEVVAALLAAAVDQRERVEKKLTRKPSH